MPHYFFDESDGELRHDHHGLEISNLGEARREAMRIAVRTLDDIPIDAPHATAHVAVRDETGAVKLIVRLTCSLPDVKSVGVSKPADQNGRDPHASGSSAPSGSS